MSIAANIQVPTQPPPVEPFSEATHEAFCEYLRTRPNRFRFTDEKYDLYRRFLLEDQDHQHRHDQRQYNQRQLSPRETSLALMSEHPDKDKQRRAKLLALREYCLDDDNRLCRKGTPPLVVLRDWQLYETVVNMHCQIPHGGQEKTFVRLSEKYYGIIRPEVRWLLKHCTVCRLNRPSRTRPPLEYTVVSRLFERVQIDLIDMRHEPDGQFKWIYHMKDHWSRFCRLVPATSRTADEIAKHAARWIYTYGPPETLQSDNSSEFKAAVEHLLEAHGIKVEHGPPQVRGLMEQANGVVQSRLAMWKTETGSSEWVKALPIIQMGINSTKHSATLKTPYEIVFGRKMVTSVLVPERVDWTTAVEQEMDHVDTENGDGGDGD